MWIRRLRITVSISHLRFFSLIGGDDEVSAGFGFDGFNLTLEILFTDRVRLDEVCDAVLSVSISHLRFFSLIDFGAVVGCADQRIGFNLTLEILFTDRPKQPPRPHTR